MAGSYRIRRAEVGDADAIYGIMRAVQDEVAHSRDDLDCWSEADRAEVSDFFLISDLPRVRRKLQNPDGFGYVVEADGGACGQGRIVGYYLFQKLSAVFDAGLALRAGIKDDDLARAIEMDSVAILPPWRGLGLQRRLEALGEEEAARRGCRHLVATVHPDNRYSLDNFLAAGFKVAARMTEQVPADRVLRDDAPKDVPMAAVDRLLLRKDLAGE